MAHETAYQLAVSCVVDADERIAPQVATSRSSGLSAADKSFLGFGEARTSAGGSVVRSHRRAVLSHPALRSLVPLDRT